MRARTTDVFKEWYAEWYNQPQAPFEIRLPMPHARQKTIIYSKKRFKVMVCGRRFGKTTAAIIKAVLLATTRQNQVIYYIAPTYKQAKSIAWSFLQKYVGRAYARRNEQELVYEFHNGSKIFLKGAENPDSLRGAFVHLAILDEYQDIRPDVWETIIRPMTLDTAGEVWFIGTPKGFNHFHKLWQDAGAGTLGKDWVAYRLTTYDNPHIPRDEIEKAKAESDPRAFAQEYLAEFVQFEGLVYGEFSRDLHVKAFDLTRIVGVDLVGIDVGADHPTAAIFARVTSGGTVYVWGEHYLRDAAVRDHAEAFKQIRGNKVIRKWFIDPSAKQFRTDLRTHGIIGTPAVNDRVFGISEIRKLLRENKIIISPKCSNLIFEFEHHHYKNKFGASSDVDKAVEKTDDDALDALRYLVASYTRGMTSSFESDPAAPTPPPFPNPVRHTFDRISLDKSAVGVYTNGDFTAPGIAPEFTQFA